MEFLEKNWLIVLIIGFQVLSWVAKGLKRLKGDGVEGAEGAEGAEASAPEDAEVDSAVLGAELLGERQRLYDELGVMRAEALEQRRALSGLSGPLEVVRSALSDAVIPALQSARGALPSESEVPEAHEVIAYMEAMTAASEAVALGRIQLSLLSNIGRWRQTRGLAELLGDADAIAGACMAPLQRFAQTHQIPFPRQEVICAPAAPGHEAVWLGLFPDRPVVFVPDDFGDDLLRWPAIAHEVGHIIWNSISDLGYELRSELDTDGGWLPSLRGREVYFDVDTAFYGWQEEIFCDMFTAWVMGPAALRGLVAIFAEPSAPDDVVWASSHDRRRFAPHPPRHLRILLVGAMLERMGYLVEPKALIDEWMETHGAPEHLKLPTAMGTGVAVEVGVFMARGHALIERLYMEPFESLGGYGLNAISGLEMTPGLWRKVEQRAKDLAEGTPFNDDPRVVICAGIEATAGGARGQIAEGVRRGIRGKGNDEARVKDARYTVPVDEGSGLALSDLRDAIILRMVLQRHPSAQRRSA